MILWLILLPFFTAACAPTVCRFVPRLAPWLLSGVPLAIFVYTTQFFPTELWQGLSGGLDWFPEFGVRFDYHLDALSAMFVLLISGIGFLVVIYSGGYFGTESKVGRFYAYLFAFMGAMLGVVLADNLIGLFVFWELTSITSYLLIGYKHAAKSSRDSALQALLVTVSGGLALFAGLIIIGLAATDLGLSAQQAMQISQLSKINLTSHHLYPVFTTLILLGAFTKSAQFPFHFWLPGAMAAPTPVSSYLHSATMVKAGIYLLARFLPILGGTTLWVTSVTSVGLITMVLGAIMALMQRDLKLVLAFSTVSVLGTLTFLLGLGHEVALTAFVVYLIAHALYKASLFQIAGIIDVKAGTRDITALGGLMRRMPITMIVAILAAFSMAGLPPFFGFYSKELLYTATLTDPNWAIILAGGCLLGATLTVAAALLVGFSPFFGHEKTTPKVPSEASFAMLIGPTILAVTGIVLGIAPFLVDQNFLSPIAMAIAKHHSSFKLALWHGLEGDAGIVVALSVVTFGVGGLLLWNHRQRIPQLNHTLLGWQRFGPQALYQRSLTGTYREAGRITRFIQNGYLRHYIAVTVLFMVAITIVPILHEAMLLNLPEDQSRFLPLDISIIIMIIAGATFVVLTHKRLSAIAALGLVGLAIVLLFTIYSAPDLAITQSLVEILTVILFVGVFYHLPGFSNFTGWKGRLRDLGIAATVGFIMTIFMLSAQSVRLDPVLTRYFAEHSMVSAFGRNVVNVILVDFRAFDTLGEMIVVAIAGFGVFSLLGKQTGRRKSQ